MAAKKKSARRNRCPLTTDPELRAQANTLTDSLQDAFPPGVSRPALRAFAAAGYLRLEQLANISDEALVRLHGVGPKALRIVREALHEFTKHGRAKSVKRK